ncbi:MAG: VOC family protein [Phycisphaeraceae bacterium]|nr:VOC family protein [Phycisphaeraceae bacterium]
MAYVRGVAEIAINVRDIGAMSEFYQRVLGLEVYGQSPEVEPTIVFLSIAAGEPGRAHPPLLVLIDPARHPPAKGKFEAPVRRTSTLNHIAFDIEASRYEAECARLEGLGLTVMRVDFPHMRAKALFFRDPEDNTVEFICPDGSAD